MPSQMAFRRRIPRYLPIKQGMELAINLMSTLMGRRARYSPARENFKDLSQEEENQLKSELAAQLNSLQSGNILTNHILLEEKGWMRWMHCIPKAERKDLCSILESHYFYIVAGSVEGRKVHNISHPNAIPAVVCWERPQEGWLKLNVDASYLRKPIPGTDHNTVVGGVFRDSSAKIQGEKYSYSLRACGVVNAELFGIHAGLSQYSTVQNLCLDFKFLKIECDNTKAVEVANGGDIETEESTNVNQSIDGIKKAEFEEIQSVDEIKKAKKAEFEESQSEIKNDEFEKMERKETQRSILDDKKRLENDGCKIIICHNHREVNKVADCIVTMKVKSLNFSVVVPNNASNDRRDEIIRKIKAREEKRNEDEINRYVVADAKGSYHVHLPKYTETPEVGLALLSHGIPKGNQARLVFPYTAVEMQNLEGHIWDAETEKMNSMQPSEVDDWANFRDDHIMQQQSTIQAEEAEKIPFVGDKEPLSSLADEYRSGSPILLEKNKGTD
ncbi:hypothetical protein ACH5RR_033336 [Cinchona calisaya]|uniref:RNase H type-1 domain-containing protein n=1 Tax=Cinchona calisaya TaxID=153742 RepID=A0ABD2YPQ9_9GENT